MRSSSRKLALIINPSKATFLANVKWQIRSFSEIPAIEAKIQVECTFFRVDILSYLPIANIFATNLKFRQFTYKAALFTTSDGTDRTQNNMYSTAAFHCTDRQCTVESTVDTV